MFAFGAVVVEFELDLYAAIDGTDHPQLPFTVEDVPFVLTGTVGHESVKVEILVQ